MAKAKKLQSGSWNVMVYSHTEGEKRKYESFTAPTKAEAEMMAAEFKARKSRKVRHDMTVYEAVDGYIAAKEGVSSPATIKGYTDIRKCRLTRIGNDKLKKLNTEKMQIFISELSKEYSPKSVRNTYGLLTAAIGFYEPDLRFRVTLPAKKADRPSSPSDEDVMRMYKAASHSMKIYMTLGMLGLRRGEISPLTYEDIEGDLIHVCKDMVKDKNGKWITKSMPKTADGDRYVKLPQSLLDELGTGTGRIFRCLPDTISKRFWDLSRKTGIDMHFHELRHYFASIAAVLGVPDIYIADMGGWKRGGSAVMKTVYQNNIKSMSDYYADRIANHIADITKEDA